MKEKGICMKLKKFMNPTGWNGRFIGNHSTTWNMRLKLLTRSGIHRDFRAVSEISYRIAKIMAQGDGS